MVKKAPLCPKHESIALRMYADREAVEMTWWPHRLSIQKAFAPGQVEDLGLYQVDQEPGVAVITDRQ
jgi:hypothetical protein